MTKPTKNARRKAHKRRLAQAQKLLDLFKDAQGSAARTPGASEGRSAVACDRTPERKPTL